MGLSNIEKKVIAFAYNNLDLPRSRFKHFTFITRRNKVIVFGVNHDKKTNPINPKHGYRWPQIHSEGSAIISFPYNKNELGDFDFYNVRINNLGKISMSAPCDHCQVLLKTHNIKKVHYTNEQEKFQEIYL